MKSVPIPVAARSNAWVCGRSRVGIVGSNPAGAWMSVFCGCCVLSGRGLRIGLITRPKESYRVWCVWLSLIWIPDNEGALINKGCCAMVKKLNQYCNWPIIQAIPIQGLRVPEGWGSQISIQSHIMVVRLSVLHTDRLYPTENIVDTQCFRGLADPSAIKSMKKSCETNRNRTRDLLVCSASAIRATTCPI